MCVCVCLLLHCSLGKGMLLTSNVSYFNGVIFITAPLVLVLYVQYPVVGNQAAKRSQET